MSKPAHQTETCKRDMQPPHILISHVDTVPAQFFTEFEELIQADGLRLMREPRPSDTLFASLEWLVPSAVVAYIVKPYFESFLKEMGKDHYGLLKQGLNTLYERVAGPKAPPTTLIGTAGKTRPTQPYSLFFSVMAQGVDKAQFKLLIQQPVSAMEYERSIAAFLDFMQDVHEGTLDEKTRVALQDAPMSGGIVLVTYSPSAGSIITVDPFEGQREKTSVDSSSRSA